MKISSDWVIYYVRSWGICENIHNRALGRHIGDIMTDMGCTRSKKRAQVRSLFKKTENEEPTNDKFARSGYTYDIEMSRLPEFFTKLSDRLGVRFE